MIDSALLDTQELTQSHCFSSFKSNFTLPGDVLFEFIFDQNESFISVKKKHVATANLKKLFAAAFKISSKIGFHEMSLRDLSRETGISMGSIYACIGKKENLAVIVKEVVNKLSANINALSRGGHNARACLETTIRMHFYTSCILQPWYSFLYMETRCLPETAQQDSKLIELNNIENFRLLLDDCLPVKQRDQRKTHLMATTILALLQDWYLKPWKNKYQVQEIDTRLNDILDMVSSFISGPSTLNSTQNEKP